MTREVSRAGRSGNTNEARLDGLRFDEQGGTSDGSLLASPSASISGGTISRIMLLIEQSLNKRNDAATSRREFAEKAQDAADAKAVEKMREAAHDTFVGGLIAGFGSVGTAMISFGALGMQQQSDALANQAKGLEGEKAFTSGEGCDLIDDRANGLMQMSKNRAANAEATRIVGTLGGGAASAGGMFSNASVKKDEAEKTDFDNASKVAQREAKRCDDIAGETKDFATRTLQRLDDILRSRHETTLSLVRA